MRTAIPAILLLTFACNGSTEADPNGPTGPSGPGPSGPSGATNLTTPSVALIDMGTAYSYKGLEGGLYAGGSNSPPQAHVTAGVAAAALIRPLSASGAPDAGGRIVMLSIGMSNARQEFCGDSNGAVATSCPTGSAMRRWATDAASNRTSLRLVNGARVAATIPDWDQPDDSAYVRLLRNDFPAHGVTEAQVQVVWLKNVYVDPTVALPATNANAYAEREGLKRVIAAAKQRYPNLRMVFLSSRTYGGWSTAPQSPEPYAFESGLAVKWLVDDYINGRMPAAPFVTWGPYLWAFGDTPRSDGIRWPRSYYANDGIHPNGTGVTQAGGLIHDFFMRSAFTPWYRN